jgi:hypothetical protein
MCLARWLKVTPLMTVVAATLLACRDGNIRPPWVEDDAGVIGGIDAGDPDTNKLPFPAPSQSFDARLGDGPADARNADPGQACGAPGQSCCPGNRCGRACCHNGTCLPVGEQCPERPELSCFGSSCGGVCGGLRQPCCGATGYCTAALTTCIRSDASSTCESCGNTGEPCCAGSYCEPPSRRCVNDRCAPM